MLFTLTDADRGFRAALSLDPAEKAPKAPGQLYDLAKDPGETTNLYFEKPEMVEELKAKLEEAKKTGRSAPNRN